jgi:hypothetical protein
LGGSALIAVTMNEVLSVDIEVMSGIQPPLNAFDVFNTNAALAISYSPTSCKFGCTGTAKQTEVSGAINLAVGATSIILGSTTTPFDGIITSVVFYSASDTAEVIEFLIGQA